VDRVLAAMAALGAPMKIVQGLRTVEEQQALFAQGRTKPGKKVTNCDGVRKKSNHQASSDGLGRAVDCAFVKDGKVVWEGPWEKYGAAARAEGLIWGGDWKGLIDRPHIELPKS
jgi:peptidoglycan L-alanyl-D-glutamate endopeptidase CwlK